MFRGGQRSLRGLGGARKHEAFEVRLARKGCKRGVSDVKSGLKGIETALEVPLRPGFS